MRQGGELLGDPVVSVEDSGMVAPAEELADVAEGVRAVLAEEIHGDVACVGDVAGAGGASDLFGGKVKVVADSRQDGIRRGGRSWRTEWREGTMDGVGGERRVCSIGERRDAIEGTLELSNVLTGLLRDQREDGLGWGMANEGGLGPEDLETLVLRRAVEFNGKPSEQS